MRKTIIAAGALALAFGGCGGSSSPSPTATFKTQYQPVEAQLKASAQQIGAAIQASAKQTDAQVFTAFQQLATSWQSNVSQLETLKPPSSLAAPFNTLRDSASRAESDLSAIAAAAATHDKSAAEQGGASIVEDILATKAAAVALDKKLGLPQT